MIKQQLVGASRIDIANPMLLQIECEILQEMGIDISDGGINMPAEKQFDKNTTAILPDEISVLKRLLLKVEDIALFSMQVAERLTSADRGILGLGAMSAPTLGEAIEFSAKAINTGMTPSTLRAQFLSSATHLSFEFLEQCDDVMVDRFLTDRSTIASAIFYREIATFDTGDMEVFLRHAKPHDQQHLGTLLGPSVFFGQSISSIRFTNTSLKQALPNANWRTFSACEKYFDSFPSEVPSNNISELVKSILVRDSSLNLQQVAQEMGVNSRTLHRRLSSEETSFQAIAEGVKIAKAERLLKGGASVKETAIEMGYSDQASFSRAFSRWCGKPPSSIKP